MTRLRNSRLDAGHCSKGEEQRENEQPNGDDE